MPTEPDPRTLTITPDEAAARLGIAPSTLAQWRYLGSGPAFLKLGGLVRYREADLAAWLDQQTRTSTSERPPRK